MKSKEYTVTLLVVAIFQLTFFGLLFNEIKIIGDVIFLSLIAILYNKDKKMEKQPTSQIIKYIRFFVKLFLFYVVVQMIYSSIMWNEALLVIQQGRRWLIAGLYFWLITSDIAKKLESKLIIKALLLFAIIVCINIMLIRAGFQLPSADYAWQYQGGSWVMKPFIPGSVILYFFVIILGITALITLNKKISYSFRIVILLFTLIVIFLALNLVPFRGWIAATLASLMLCLLIYSIYRRKFIIWVSLGVVAFAVINIFPNQVNEKIAWISSASDEFMNVQDNYKFRYLNDITKLYYLTSNPIYLNNGLGFVHKSSGASKELNFSTETNDTGWVEVALTGGIIGMFIFLLMYLSIFIYFISSFFKTKLNKYLICLGIWCMCGLLMISSNLLLWDFGFVPLSLIVISYVSKKDNTYVTKFNEEVICE